MCNKNLDNIIVFTDGSCTKNGKIDAMAGVGIYFPNKEFDDISESFTQTPITNQRAELYAIYKALLIVTENSTFNKLIIYSDSLYSIKCVTEWIKKWETNNWMGTARKPILNQDIIKLINNILKKYEGKVIFKHVRSHTGEYTIEAIYNDRVDKLACDGCNKKNQA
jgi:ribonuclease HI